MSTLQRAIEIAVSAHQDQTRKDGSPYILHPMRVMFQQTDEEAMIVAILHDVVEDTNVSMDDIRREGFSVAVTDALGLVTHDAAEPYSSYVRKIASNHLAGAVKLADLQDNMKLREIPELSDKDLERTRKYHRAWKELSDV